MTPAGTNPLTRPLDIVIVRGGVDTVFASAAALSFFSWAVRRDLWGSADAAAPAIVAALATWHAGCLTSGSCLGTPSGMPWAWAATDGGVARHPTELYAAAALALLVAALLISRRRLARFVGASTALAILGVSIVRLLTEPLRLTIGGGPWWWYATGVTLGAVLLVWRSRSPADPGSPVSAQP